MSETVIKVENISKFYQLGLINHGTLAKDLQGWWAKIRGKDDPNSRISMVSKKSSGSDTDFIYALKDVSFDVQQGEVLGIIGANGAGKSTLLKILSRVTSPTSGCIKIKGRIGSLLEVGTGFHPDLTGRENIYLNGAILGMRKHEIDKKLDEIIDFSGVEKFIDTPVKRYSSGMYVRLAFAVAAHLDPEILVVDEVLAVGDAEFQKKCLGKMDDVSKKEGRTVLFVSHNMASIRALCKHGIILENGQLKFNGSIDSAIDEYMKTSLDEPSYNAVANMPRKGRCSNKIRFMNIEFLDKNNVKITPQCGQFLRIKIKLNVAEDLKGCRISLGIYDMYGNILTTFPTDVTMDTFSLKHGEQYAILDIEKLPLTVGSYRLLLWCDVYKECADYIDRIIRMDVEQDDFYGLGREIPAHVFGKVVLCEHKWNV